MLQYTCVNRKLENMKKRLSEIFKHTRSRKPDAEETSHIEGCMKLITS